MTKAKIRLYKKKDLNQVLRIEILSFSEPWSPIMFEALSEMNPKGFYVIAKGSKILGYALVFVEPYFGEPYPTKRAHLINLAIHPDFRNRGFGRELVHRMIKDMESAKVHSIFLEVRKSNKKAHEFYSRLLFQRTGSIKGFYKDEDAIVMSKTISK